MKYTRYLSKITSDNNDKWDRRWLGLAKEISDFSKDPSTKVGAVIIRPDRSLCSIGFNGLPKGIKDKSEVLNDRALKYKQIIHAEINAQIFAREPIEGYTLYTYPFMPCCPCTSFFIQCGISRVVAPESQNERWKEDFELAGNNFNEADVDLCLYTDFK